MKCSTKLVLATVCVSCAWPAAAQLANPPSRQAAASGNNSAVVPDGVTFYHGQTFLLRNGRAALVDGTLVPEGQVLTRAGRLVPMPPELTGRPEPRNQITPPATSDSVQDGIVHTRGKSYLVRGNTLQPIDNKLIPEGSVLNDANTLSPLPSDFSGFNVERTPAGTSTLPVRTGDGTQALSGQAGVQQQNRSAPQAPRITTPQPGVAPAGASGFTRTGVVSNPNGTSTPVGITPNGAAVALDGNGTVMTGTAVNAAGSGSVNASRSVGGSSANGALPGATYSGSTAAGVAAGTTTFSAPGGGRTFQPGMSATGRQTTTTPGAMTTEQGITTGSQQGTVTNPNGTTSTAQPGTTGTVNSQAAPTATQTGAVTSQSNPPATQTGTVGNQGTPTATQTGTTATGGNTNNPNSTPGSGSTATGGFNGVNSGTTGSTGTTGGGTSGGTTGGGTSGGSSGGGTSGGGGSSGGSSGGGTSGGSSGGGTSGGAGGGAGGGGT